MFKDFALVCIALILFDLHVTLFNEAGDLYSAKSKSDVPVPELDSAGSRVRLTDYETVSLSTGFSKADLSKEDPSQKQISQKCLITGTEFHIIS